MLAETLERSAPHVGAILARRRTEAMQSILELLVPQVPPPQHMLLEAPMTEARKAVLESGDWLTAAQIAEMVGFSSNNPNPSRTSGRGTASSSHSALEKRLLSWLLTGSPRGLSPAQACRRRAQDP